MSDLLYTSEFFSKKFNCSLYFKPEWYGPTRSHKDKWAKKAIKLAKHNRANKVVALSSGNQGLALAVEAYKQKIDCVICVEKSIDPAYLQVFKKYSAEAAVAENEEEQYKTFERLVSKGYFPLGVTHKQRAQGYEMPAIDGYKITATEIINAFNKSPDVVVFPTAYADHPKGVLRGFVELLKAKKIFELPKFILVRAHSFDGNKASSIATERTTPYITDVIKRTNGEDVYVNNEEMGRAQKLIFEEQGWNVELASAAGIAGLEKIPKNILNNKLVIVMLTALEDKTGI